MDHKIEQPIYPRQDTPDASRRIFGDDTVVGHWTAFPTAAIHRGLSLRAIGLLAKLLSHDRFFSISLEKVIYNCQEGHGAVRKASGELRAAGHIVYTVHTPGKGFHESDFKMRVFATAQPRFARTNSCAGGAKHMRESEFLALLGSKELLWANSVRPKNMRPEQRVFNQDTLDSQFYAPVPNQVIRSSSLSLRAIGLLAKLLSHGPSFNHQLGRMHLELQEGSHLTRSVQQELRDLGHLFTEPRCVDGKVVGLNTYVFATPQEALLSVPKDTRGAMKAGTVMEYWHDGKLVTKLAPVDPDSFFDSDADGLDPCREIGSSLHPLAKEKEDGPEQSDSPCPIGAQDDASHNSFIPSKLRVGRPRGYDQRPTRQEMSHGAVTALLPERSDALPATEAAIQDMVFGRVDRGADQVGHTIETAYSDDRCYPPVAFVAEDVRRWAKWRIPMERYSAFTRKKRLSEHFVPAGWNVMLHTLEATEELDLAFRVSDQFEQRYDHSANVLTPARAAAEACRSVVDALDFANNSEFGVRFLSAVKATQFSKSQALKFARLVRSRKLTASQLGVLELAREIAVKNSAADFQHDLDWWLNSRNRRTACAFLLGKSGDMGAKAAAELNVAADLAQATALTGYLKAGLEGTYDAYLTGDEVSETYLFPGVTPEHATALLKLLAALRMSEGEQGDGLFHQGVERSMMNPAWAEFVHQELLTASMATALSHVFPGEDMVSALGLPLQEFGEMAEQRILELYNVAVRLRLFTGSMVKVCSVYEASPSASSRPPEALLRKFFSYTA